MKKIFKLSIIIALILIIAAAIYFLFIKKKPSAPVQPPTQPTEQVQIPAAPAVKIKKISENPVFDFWTTQDSKEIFYLDEQGKVWAAKQGPDLEITKQAVNALNFIKISPANTKILAAFDNPLSPQWLIFDIIDKTWRPLPDNILKAAWLDNDNKLITIVKDGNYLNLAEIDISKTPPSSNIIIRDFRLKDVDFVFKPPQFILISEKPSGFYPGRVWQLNLKDQSFNLILGFQTGLILKWFNKESLFLKYSSPTEFSVTDQNFNETIPLFFSTMISKCSINAFVLYCFVPQEFPPDLPNLNLPDDYFQKRFYTIDNLYSVDLTTENTILILTSNTAEIPALDAKNPQILDGKLYFVNNYDNGLYEVGL